MGPVAWRSPLPETLRGKETMTNRLPSSRTVIFLAGLVALTSVRMTAAAVELEFDHVWIVVSRDAPERAALERAGFKISPNVNRNDGQGTASVSAEFLNAYIELMWPDPTVSVGRHQESIFFHRTVCARGRRRSQSQTCGERSETRLVSTSHRRRTNHCDSNYQAEGISTCSCVHVP
jgi:hypothetical protein